MSTEACRPGALWEIGSHLAVTDDRRYGHIENSSSITIAELDDRHSIERPTAMVAGDG